MFEIAAPDRRSKRIQAPLQSPRWSLWVAILGSTLVFVDGTVVNVALPMIQRELEASVALTQWVVEAYALFLASLVLIGGALGDRYGRRRLFSIGAIVFALASAGCALAPSPLALVCARGLQGVGGALLVPGSLALISAAYPERERGPAIGTWSAASSITSAIGPVLGGWVVTHASFRWLFWVNVPIGFLVALLSFRHVAESRDDSVPRRMDWPGAALAAGGLGLIVYALLEGGEARGAGHVSPWTLLAGAALLALFVAVEAKSAAPMLPLGLFRSRTFSATNLLTLLLYAALGAAMFFLPFELIEAHHYTPAAAGAALLPFVLLMSLLSRWAGGFSERRGARTLLIAGPLLSAGGFVLLGLRSAGDSYVRSVLPGIILLGTGMGLTIAPLTAAVMGSVDTRHAGVASGINNAVARTAILLAIAGLGLIVIQAFSLALERPLAALDPALRRLALEQREKLAAPDLSFAPAELRDPLQRAFAHAFSAGFRALMLACAGLAVLAALVGAFLPKAKGEKHPSRRDGCSSPEGKGSVTE